MEITILGTSAMVPTRDRNPTSVFLNYKNQGILFDCGEGAQKQMNIAGISRTKINKILISHWHGDHVAGLIGLLQTIGHSEENHTIELYGPKHSKKFMKSLIESCYFDVKIDLKVIELKPKKVEKFFENEDYELHCCALDHVVPCLGYSFIEKEKRNIDVAFLKKHNVKEGPHLEKLRQGKDITVDGKKVKASEATYLVSGKKISYVMDTAFTTNAIKLAKDSDLLLAEATFQEKHQQKAEDYRHLTAKEAAQIASQSNSKQLVLTHFSQRYKEVSELLEEAREIFPETKDGFDLMKITL